MKKLLTLLLILFVFTCIISAEDGKGLMVANAGIGWGGIAGGLELDFVSFDLGPVPLYVGASARASFDPFFGGYGSTWAVGAFANGRIGFGNIDVPFLNKSDVYLGLGFGLAGILAKAEYDSWGWKPGLGFSYLVGATYDFAEHWGVYGEYGYIGRYTYDYTSYGYNYTYSYPVYYATVGISYKF